MNSLDIRLEKTDYLAGEEAKGEIIISIERDLEFKNFKFYAQGKEDPLKSIPDYHDDSSGSWRDGSYQYSPSSEKVSNIFFFKDLTDSFTTSHGIKISNDGTVQLKKGQWTVPFNFSIPTNSLESFEGQYVSITCEVAVTASGIFLFDRHENRAFTVLNPNYTQKVEGKTISLFDKPIILDWKEQEEIKHGLKASLILDNDKYSFSPGETLRGRISVTSAKDADKKIPKIKKVDITLSKIEDSTKITPQIARNEVFKQQLSRNQLEENSPNNSLVFGIPLTNEIQRKRNYAGKLTAYYWLLEAKLDMGLTHHFHRSTVLEVF